MGGFNLVRKLVTGHVAFLRSSYFAQRRFSVTRLYDCCTYAESVGRRVWQGVERG